MKIEQVLQTYDAQYAAEYDQTFLHDEWSKASVAFQLALLGQHLRTARRWLDVACGTGFVLSQFPEIERTGLDISPAMLAHAHKRNPGVRLVEGDFRAPRPEWNDQWDVVSCMWWAYCLVESMTEIRQLVGRLAAWTAPEGTCFLPLCNPQKFDSVHIRIPYVDPKVPGRIMITGITWTYIQDNGKRHDDVVSPQVEHMVSMFEEHFDDVRVVEGPMDQIGEGWRVQDVLVARRKRHAVAPA